MRSILLLLLAAQAMALSSAFISPKIDMPVSWTATVEVREATVDGQAYLIFSLGGEIAVVPKIIPAPAAQAPEPPPSAEAPLPVKAEPPHGWVRSRTWGKVPEGWVLDRQEYFADGRIIYIIKRYYP